MLQQVSIPHLFHCHPQYQPVAHPDQKTLLAVQVHQGTDPTLGLPLALALLIFGDAYCNQATRTH
jgi:hypothetical protein